MIWYPNDVNRRPLQVSFYVVRYDNGNFKRIHETELVDHLGDLLDFIRPSIIRSRDAVIFEVSISMTYRGRELLGVDGAIETTGGPRGPDTRRIDGEPVSVLYGPGLRYAFHAQDDFYHYRYTVNHEPIHDVMLPAAETNLEWTLMSRRIERLKIELGDASERQAADALLEHIGREGLIAYTLTAPLEQVLTQPRPEAIANKL